MNTWNNSRLNPKFETPMQPFPGTDRHGADRAKKMGGEPSPRQTPRNYDDRKIWYCCHCNRSPSCFRLSSSSTQSTTTTNAIARVFLSHRRPSGGTARRAPTATRRSPFRVRKRRAIVRRRSRIRTTGSHLLFNGMRACTIQANEIAIRQVNDCVFARRRRPTTKALHERCIVE